jgi:hypothetical protein
MTMTWFAASVIMVIRFQDGVQDKYPVWENVILIDASSVEEAYSKAEQYGREDESSPDESVTWEGRVAQLVFGGVRKLIEIRNASALRDQPGDGAEITYSQFELDSDESLSKLIKGEEVSVLYRE